MSFTDARDRIVAALNTVAGVHASVSRPKTIGVGAAWPLFDGAQLVAGSTFEGTWRVMLALGGDERAALAKGDELLPLVTRALWQGGGGHVYQLTPGILQTGAGDMFAWEIFVRSE